ncbi:MAG TPA: hypothetical protein VNI83_15280 [Vicinamibacterales bacterium]|nr:hypothetical protein [Vicinamibacterales bacterium]
MSAVGHGPDRHVEGRGAPLALWVAVLLGLAVLASALSTAAAPPAPADGPPPRITSPRRM